MKRFSPKGIRRLMSFVLGWLLFALILLNPWQVFALPPEGVRVFALTALMVVWWLTEAVPMPVSSLMPAILLPVMQVLTFREAAALYAHPVIALFLGGFLLALAVEKWNLHKRIALLIIRRIGTSPKRLIISVMLSTAFISMWVSNTATAVIMLPIAVSLVNIVLDRIECSDKARRNLFVAVLLAVAYSANVGGMATLIGTPPNAILAGFLQTSQGIDISFARWLLVGIPVALAILLLAYVLITRVFFRVSITQSTNIQKYIAGELRKLGSFSKSERRVLIIFGFTLLLWLSKGLINNYILAGKWLSDGAIAVLGGASLFIVPVDLKRDRFLLHWDDSRRLPWGILLLFGGALSLANALDKTGVIASIGQWVQSYQGLNTLLITVLAVGLVLFMTELIGGTALTTIFLPAVIAIAQGLDIPLLYICIPVTLAASGAFMLPIATPPNAIIFASGHIHVRDMIKIGWLLNLLTILVIILIGLPLVRWVFL